MKNIYLIIILAVFLVPPASAVIIDVPGDYATIQGGIDAAQNGDTVLVAPGLYLETVTIENKNILLTTSEGPETTTLKGFLRVRLNVDTTCVFSGFTVIGDPDDPWYELRSLIDINGGSPTIEGNIVKNGDARYAAGGGISALYSDAIIKGNIIKYNIASVGGGISAAVGNSLIEGNIISHNIAGSPSHGGAGGGIVISSGTVKYNLISNNLASSGVGSIVGGGLYAYNPYNLGRRINNNTIIENRAVDGGGVWLYARSDQNDSVFFKNNIIAFNPYGGGVYAVIRDSAEVDWDYNLVFGNDSANYIGMEPGPHDIQADPLFVDRFSGDYHLLPNSPCIDKGDPDFPLDPDGTRADIGAYYYDQQVGVDDPGEPSGPYRFQLHQNYPNPFNAQTIISYALSENSVVSLMIFSIRGQFVESIANKEMQEAGEHQYTWDGTDKNGKEVSTGIYFYELYVDDHRESKAMIMIK